MVRATAARGAHPRVGGENYGVEIELSPGYGSSPRGRGKHEHHSEGDAHSRLIPAWAGKTAGYKLFHARVPAHPRVGGENSGQGV